MDTGPIKPAARIPPNRLAASRPNATAATAPTDLPSSQSVTPAAGAARGAHDQTMHHEIAHRTARGMLIDPQIREAMSRASRPGRAQGKEAALKLRAYRGVETEEEPDPHSLEKTV